MNIFNARELIDMGIAKEKKRRDFYGLAADRFQDAGLRKLFTDLQAWEETHIKRFSEIRESVKELEATDSYPGELDSYINAIIDEKLYNDVSPDNFSRNVKDPIDAVKYGIGFEKDAILFFREVIAFMPAAKRPSIESLIEEEKKHLLYLVELKRSLQAK